MLKDKIILGALALITGGTFIMSDPIHTVKTDFKVESQTVHLAMTQLGVRETRLNSGPDIEKYHEATNSSDSSEWCASFIVWSLKASGKRSPAMNGMVKSLFPENRLVKRSQVKQGDIYGMTDPMTGRLFHAGIVAYTGIDVIGWYVVTIEGNTTSDMVPSSASGKTKGDGVHLKKRRPSVGDVFSRW